jgi:hypothetical protein
MGDCRPLFLTDAAAVLDETNETLFFLCLIRKRGGVRILNESGGLYEDQYRQ